MVSTFYAVHWAQCFGCWHSNLGRATVAAWVASTELQYTPFQKSLAVGSCFLLSNTAIMKSVLKDNFETLGLKNEVFQRKWRHRIQSPNSYISALHPPFFLYRPPQRYRPSVIRGLIKTQANLFIHQIVNRTRAGGRLCCFLRWNLYWKQIWILTTSCFGIQAVTRILIKAKGYSFLWKIMDN